MTTGNAFAFETINILDKPVGFSPHVFSSNLTDNPHVRAIVTSEGGHIRYKYTGDAPNITSGHLLEHGYGIVVEGLTNIGNFKAIKIGTKQGILSVTYERVYA